MKGIKYILVFVVVVIGNWAFGQNPKFDRLEMLFAQHHYKRVYRLSNRLLDKPEYDYSMMPTYYKSLSLFQLAQNEYWFKRHPEALDNAVEMLLEVKSSSSGKKIFDAHMYELAWLKQDLASWASDLKRTGQQDNYMKVRKAIVNLFGEIPDNLPQKEETQQELVEESTEETNTNEGESSGVSVGQRDKIVLTAKEHIGTPYKWAGNAPGGFDCSGFTSYVLGQYGAELPRRSSDQYQLSKKVKEKNVRKGDLIFFSNGSGVSHVGIIISEKGESLKMIHSSSSKGIIITDVEASEYWMKRLHGFGTFVD